MTNWSKRARSYKECLSQESASVMIRTRSKSTVEFGMEVGGKAVHPSVCGGSYS
jgi:hypothetical protein